MSVTVQRLDRGNLQGKAESQAFPGFQHPQAAISLELPAIFAELDGTGLSRTRHARYHNRLTPERRTQPSHASGNILSSLLFYIIHIALKYNLPPIP